MRLQANLLLLPAFGAFASLLSLTLALPHGGNARLNVIKPEYGAMQMKDEEGQRPKNREYVLIPAATLPAHRRCGAGFGRGR